MHWCGNPFHDLITNLIWGLPFIGPTIIWLRHKFFVKKCCDHKHK